MEMHQQVGNEVEMNCRGDHAEVDRATVQLGSPEAKSNCKKTEFLLHLLMPSRNSQNMTVNGGFHG